MIGGILLLFESICLTLEIICFVFDGVSFILEGISLVLENAFLITIRNLFIFNFLLEQKVTKIQDFIEFTSKLRIQKSLRNPSHSEINSFPLWIHLSFGIRGLLTQCPRNFECLFCSVNSIRSVQLRSRDFSKI